MTEGRGTGGLNSGMLNGCPFEVREEPYRRSPVLPVGSGIGSCVDSCLDLEQRGQE